MNKEEILAGLKEIISIVKPKLDLQNVTMKSQLVSELGIDSLSMLLVALAVEEKFKIKFDSASNFNTVEEVCDFIIAAKK